MQLMVNGEDRTIQEPISIAALLAAHNLDARRVVVEHNREIVPRDRYAETLLQSGDEIDSPDDGGRIGHA